MKKLSTLLTAAFVLGAIVTKAQVVPDQNPRHAESRNKYARLSDSLLVNEGTTFQQTYKAYDYVQLKQDRKDQRRQQRHELRMARATANYSYYDRWNNNSRWNNYYNSYLGRPSIGFRTGNWWFGW